MLKFNHKQKYNLIGTAPYVFRHYGAKPKYKFYESDGSTEITDITVSGLANAYYYTKNDSEKLRVGGKIFYINESAGSTEDMFYVYAVGGLPTSGVSWSNSRSTTIPGLTDDGVGIGKQRTITLRTTASTWSDAVIIRHLYYYYNGIDSSIAPKFADCDDWFIGSKAEYDILRSSGIEEVNNWFANNNIWSTVQDADDSDRIWYWDYSFSSWHRAEKNGYAYRFIPLRSF